MANAGPVSSRGGVVRADAAALEEIRAHGGKGRIGFRRLVAGVRGDALHFVDLALVPPGSSIGTHTHNSDEEEYYFVVEGTATMTLDGEPVRVGPGDLVHNRAGGTHSLTNDGGDPVRLLVFEVAAR